MGWLTNLMLFNNIDGAEGAIREQSEKFRRKFPYDSIIETLGGAQSKELANLVDFTPANYSTSYSRYDVAYQSLVNASDMLKPFGRTLFKWRLVNSQTGLYEDVSIILKQPENYDSSIFDTSSGLTLNIPPFKAEDLRPIRELLLRYFGVCKYSLTKLDFAHVAIHELWGKKMSFTVLGSASSLLRRFATAEHDSLLVWSDEIEKVTEQKLAKFKTELQEIKESFQLKKTNEERLLQPGAILNGKIQIETWFLPEPSIDLQGVNIYSASLVCSGDPYNLPKEWTGDFHVVSIDQTALCVNVSAPELDKEIAQKAILEEERLNQKVNKARCSGLDWGASPIIKGLDGAPLFLDGNNIILTCGDRYGLGLRGWVALRALVDFLEQQGVSYHLFFDATYQHLFSNGKIDKEGNEFIRKLEKDLNRKNAVTICPAGTEADMYILMCADIKNAHILSNDRFKDRSEKYPWTQNKGNDEERSRVHRFIVFEKSLFIVESLGISVPLTDA